MNRGLQPQSGRDERPVFIWILSVGWPIQASICWVGKWVGWPTPAASAWVGEWGSYITDNACRARLTSRHARGLRRFQQSGDLHFVPSLPPPRTAAGDAASEVTGRTCAGAGAPAIRFWVSGYVLTPQHVHMLVSEPERATLATALQAMKQPVSRRLICGREHSGRRDTTISMRTPEFKTNWRRKATCIGILWCVA